MIQREGSKTIVTPTGRIDTNNAPLFADTMNEALAGTEELVLDFCHLDYISSSGLKVVLRTVKTMLAQGEMRIVNVSKDIYEVLEVTGFIGFCEVEMKT